MIDFSNLDMDLIVCSLSNILFIIIYYIYIIILLHVLYIYKYIYIYIYIYIYMYFCKETEEGICRNISNMGLLSIPYIYTFIYILLFCSIIIYIYIYIVYHQILGTAIGTKFAPHYANIFMVWKKRYFKNLTFNPTFGCGI